MRSVTPAELAAMTEDEVAALDLAGLLEAAQAIPGMHRERRQRLHALIGASRRKGVTWQDIAFHLGLRSPQAAQQRWKQLDREFGDVPQPSR